MSIQIKKKFLRSNSVDGSKVLFLNEDSFNALKSDGSAEISLFKLDSENKFQLLEMPRVSADPSHVNELTRKSYVDGLIQVEAAARSAADLAESETREAADLLIRSDFASADALVLQDSKDYTDEAISEEAALRSSEDSEIREEFAYADHQEALLRSAADQLLRDDLDSEISTRTSEDVRVLSESKTYTDQEVLAEKTRAMGVEASLQSEINTEEATRFSEDVRVLGESKSYTDQEVAKEKTRAMGVEALLQSEIDAEEATRFSEDVRVLSESKSYTDSSIAAVINMAPEQYDTLKEIADYIAADQTGTAQILLDLADHESRLDVIEGTGEGSIAKAEQDAKDYTDQEVLAEKTRAMGVEAQLQSEIDDEEVLRASEDVRVLGESKTYTDQEVGKEKTRAMGVEASLQSEINAEEVRAAAAEAAIMSDLDDLDGYAQEIRSDLDQEILDRISEDTRVLGESKTYTDQEVAKEKTRAMGVEAQLQSEINTEEATRASEDIRVLSDSKAYTDSKVAAVIGAAPQLLDTLEELANALGNDENFATSVTGYITSAKEEAKAYAVQQVNALGLQYAKDSFVVNQSMIDNGYIDLSHKAFEMSIVFTIDRLMLLDGEDYTVSIVDGKTRLTFAGSIMPLGEEELAMGDILRVRYLKDVRQ